MPPPNKPALRAAARAILASLSPTVRTAASAQICAAIRALPEWSASTNIALFVPFPSEPDITSLLDSPGKTFCFPRVSGETMDFLQCPSLSLMCMGPWKILEPHPDDCPLVPAPDIDLLIIPGLAFTPDGHRLGRGAGHYDRFLARAHPRAIKLGVCFHAQLVPAMPIDPHDIPMHRVVTEPPPHSPASPAPRSLS